MFTRTLRVGMLTYYKMDLSKSIGYSWTITHKTGINSPFQMVQTALKHLIKATKSTAKRQYIFFMSGEDYALVLDFINYISYFIHFFLQESSRFFQLLIELINCCLHPLYARAHVEGRRARFTVG